MATQPGSDEAAAASRRSTAIACGLFLACLVFNLALAAIGWNNTILDNIAFRQAQTALSTHFMLGHCYAVAYETPVLGPPWCIPYEFPLYEWLVAGLATVAGWELDPTGRLVSRAFFLLTLVPCYHLLRLLGLALYDRLVTLALLLASPFYIFWSRTFLIESTALFLAACYLVFAFSFVERSRIGSAPAALALGVLAAVVKITTFAVFAGAMLLLGLHVCLRYRRGELPGPALAQRLGVLAVLVAVPTGAGLLWTAFADAYKSQNQFGQHLTSAGLREWNYGTLAQRCRPETWQVIFGRTHLAGTCTVLALAGAAAVGLARRRRLQYLGCLAAYVVPPLVLTNLYYFHDYYAFANNLFLIAALGIALAALRERGGWFRTASSVALAAFLGLAPVLYWLDYYQVQAVNVEESLPACRTVREQTATDDVILVIGCDWSSEVPYYSRRRALALPTSWGHVSLDDLPVYLEPLRGYRVGALVVHHPDHYRPQLPGVHAALSGLGLTARLAYADTHYEVYTLGPSP